MSHVPVDRGIPRSVALLVARLSQDQPFTVTRAQLQSYLDETGVDRGLESVLRELVSLGWLMSTPRYGVWAFIAPGDTESSDPYLGLRAWQASDLHAVLALAGATAAWHLGFLARQPAGPISIWTPTGTTIPRGLRQQVATVTLGWHADKATAIGPQHRWLIKRKLDLTRWSHGIAAFGPEALLVQLGVRPSSFYPWADLATRLDALAASCDITTLLNLLEGQPTSVHQRVAYLLAIGGQPVNSATVLDSRPTQQLSHVVLGNGAESQFSARHQLTDRLVAPFLALFAKA
jgi:AbiEi antitoxin C-terminal domain